MRISSERAHLGLYLPCGIRRKVLARQARSKGSVYLVVHADKPSSYWLTLKTGLYTKWKNDVFPLGLIQLLYGWKYEARFTPDYPSRLERHFKILSVIG